MRVEKGVPRNPPTYDDTPPEAGVSIETSGAGEGAGKHGAGLMNEETCADENEDEDDQPRRRRFASYERSSDATPRLRLDVC